MSESRLVYVHDPMCSWCWAYRPALDRLLSAIDGRIDISMLLGGLAPDTDEPMPAEMRESLQATWRRIQEHVPGTEFDFGFWEENVPRRATFRACRAVIAARAQRAELSYSMVDAIQRAYYLNRRNPSDREVLIELAGELDCDTRKFASDLDADDTSEAHDQERQLAAQLGVQGYPTLLLITHSEAHRLPVDFRDHESTLGVIDELVANPA